MTELDFDRLGNAIENVRIAWNSLTPEQKAEVSNKVSSAMTDAGAEEEDAAGTSDESEFQRMGKAYIKAGGYFELLAVLSGLAVVTAPMAPIFVAIGTMFIIWGTLGSSITVQRAKDIGTWLAAKHPKAYKIFCENPGLLYGDAVMGRNPDGPWYMMDSCSIDTEMLTVGPSGLVSAAEIAAGGGASMPEYPSWAESNSSSSSSSNLLTLGLVAGAVYLVFK